MFIFPYKNGSESVKSLKQILGVKEIKLEGSRFVPSPNKLVINWGSHRDDPLNNCNTINKPQNVKKAGNKLQAFEILSEGVDIPKFTKSRQEASEWLAEGVCKYVVCRTVLNGHSGEGIVISSNEEELVDAPLYVQYIPKKEEYRVHVYKDEAFFVQRKARKREADDEQVNWKIRNHHNGFIFAHLNVDIQDKAKELAVKAVEKLGLDFGAVDIIYNLKQDKYYVLEVNTAPGLEGETLRKYVEVFEKLR